MTKKECRWATGKYAHRSRHCRSGWLSVVNPLFWA